MSSIKFYPIRKLNFTFRIVWIITLYCGTLLEIVWIQREILDFFTLEDFLLLLKTKQDVKY